MELLCNNSLRLKVVYYIIVTRSSILNVGRGPRPAFDYNGVLLKFFINLTIFQEYSNEKYKNWNHTVTKIIRNHVKQCSYHK